MTFVVFLIIIFGIAVGVLSYFLIRMTQAFVCGH